MIYFISGHVNLTQEEFDKIYVPKIEEILGDDNYPEFVVGDCDGVDTFAMNYIFDASPDIPLTICHMKDSPRNLPEGFIDNYEKYDDVDNFYVVGGFNSDEERDAYMTRNSDFDIAYVKDNRWDSGTAKNIKRRYGI